MIPALLQVVGSAVEFDDVYGVAVLGVRSFSLPRSSRMVKRMFDVFSASLGLAMAAPLMAVAAASVKLTSRGPVFFRQERVGRGGRPFELLKFRSMCADAEERKRDSSARTRPPKASSRSLTIRGSRASDGSSGGPISTSYLSF